MNINSNSVNSATVEQKSGTISSNTAFTGNFDSFFENKIERVLSSKIENFLSQPEFLNSLKDKLGIAPPGDEFIDKIETCRLLNIKRSSCHNRVKAGILIAHRTKGCRKVMFSKQQVLSTLKPITNLKREF